MQLILIRLSGLEVLDVHDIRARRMGPYTLVDLHMVVHSRMSITAAGHAALRLRKHVSETMPEVWGSSKLHSCLQ